MTVDEYLNRCRDLRKYADRMKDRYAEKQAAAMRAGSGLVLGGERGRSYRDNDKALVAMIDAREKYQEAALNYLEYRQNLFCVLIDMPEIDEASVLIERYINEVPSSLLCESENLYRYGAPMSRRNVFRLLKSGKEHLREMLQRSGMMIE